MESDELAQRLHQALLSSEKSLATAESCTGGRIAQMITANPGSSSYFKGGVVAYSNELKTRLLSVPEEILKTHGAVSAEVAEALALGALDQLGADIGISTTGIAGPGGGSEHKPVGLVFIGFAWRSDSGATDCRVIQRRFQGDRERVQIAASYTALEVVRRFLERAPELATRISSEE